MRLALLLMVAPLLMTALPTATAQNTVCGVGLLTCATTVSMAITPPSEAIPVAQGQVVVPIVVTYVYTQTLSMTFSDTPITLRVTRAPSWAEATISPSTVYAPVNELQGLTAGLSAMQTINLPATLFLSAAPDAPAFTSAAIEVRADAASNGALAASTTENMISVQADYFGLTQITAPGDIGLTGGRSQSMPLTVTNFGNGLTTITWSLAHAPKGINVRLPDDLALPSKQTGGDHTSAIAPVRISAPGDFEDGDVVLVAQGAYALDPQVRGDAHAVAFHVHHGASGGDVSMQSLGSGEPAGVALQSGLAVAALAGVAMVARWRKLNP